MQFEAHQRKDGSDHKTEREGAKHSDRETDECRPDEDRAPRRDANPIVLSAVRLVLGSIHPANRKPGEIVEQRFSGRVLLRSRSGGRAELTEACD
jgi:hypothetical protein